VDPTRATQLALGFWPARAFSAAAEVGVFALLEAEGPLPVGVLADRLGLRSPAVVDLLDALVALGVLARDGDAYRSLVVPDPSLLGAADGDAYRAWAELPAALRGERASMFAGLGPDELARFAAAMGEVSAPAHAAVADLVAPGERVCDVGGGDGRLAVAIAERGAVATTFDRLVPDVPGVSAVGGDFFVDELPPSDTAVLCLVLLDWSTDDKRRLLARVAASTGRIIVVDRLGPPDRPTGAFDLLRSLHLLVTVGDAFHYSYDDLVGWLSEVGLVAGPPREVGAGLTLVEGRAG
jgi:DNA-binding Lrp family transcriptional regulator